MEFWNSARLFSFRVFAHFRQKSRELELAPTARGAFKNNRKYGELNNPGNSGVCKVFDMNTFSLL